MSKQRKLTLWVYEQHEMAALKEGRTLLHIGNYWDFHPGCMGTKIHLRDGVIDFAKEWKEIIRQPWSVAEMVAKKIGATVVVKKRRTPFNC